MTSYVNQGYDQFVVNNDKKVVTEMLYTQRNITHFVNNKGGQIDQYEHIFKTSALVVATTPQTWVSSYDFTNLNPLSRVGFKIWCRDKISRFLQA